MGNVGDVSFASENGVSTDTKVWNKFIKKTMLQN